MPIKIFITEDESIVALDLRRILTRGGYQVVGLATTGAEAIEGVRQTLPDLVLMDITLHGTMTGIEAATEILHEREVPIIFVTANSDLLTVQKAQNINPFGYVLKPFDEREIRIVVEMALYKHKIEQEMREQRSWLAATLHSIGDAVIATDAENHIKFLNPVAEKLTGWPEAAAIGKPLEEVFRIVNAKTREVVENPAQRVLREGRVVGLANHTVLLAKTGAEIHIDDAAAPILDERQIVKGVVLTFRDVSDKQQVEENLRRQNDYLSSLHETSLALLNRLEINELLKTILARASALADTPHGVIDLVDVPKGVIRQSLGIGIYSNFNNVEHPLTEGLSGKIWQTKKTILLDDYETWPERVSAIPSRTLHATVGVPLKSGEEVIGVVGLAYVEPERKFTTEQIKILESFAQLASIALDNAQLYLSTQQEIRDRRLAEEALRLAADQLRLLTDNMTDMIVRTNIVGTILYASPSHEAVLGYETDWLLGHTIFEFVHPEDLTRVMTAIQVGKETSGAGRMELRYRHRQGHYLWIETIGNIIYNDQQEMSGAIFTSREIAKRKLAEQQIARTLQESETFANISRVLNETLDLSYVLQMIVDASRQVVPQSERAVIHLVDEELTALRPAAIAGVENRNLPMATMRPGEGIAGRVFATGQAINVSDVQTDPSFLRLRSTSSMRSMLCVPIQRGNTFIGTISLMSNTPNSFDANDESLLTRLGVQAALAIDKARAYEIERRRAEQAEALQHVTQELIGRVTLDEVLQNTVNTIARIERYKYVRIFLIENKTLTLKAHNDRVKNMSRTLHLHEGVIGRVARTGAPTLVPNVALDPDYLADLPSIHSCIGIPLFQNNVSFAILLIESEDIEHPLNPYDFSWLITVGQGVSLSLDNLKLYTDLQESLRQEKQARAQLVRTEKLAGMGQLIASVAHELNNPLQAIQNALFLVKHESGLSVQATEDLQVALSEADRMAELIGRLRETYRPTTAEHFQPASLNTLVLETQRLMSTHARHHNVTFEFAPNPDIPFVPCIQDEIKQVLLNLSLNGIEAMPNGGKLTITTGHEPNKNEVWVTVSDTGLGIDENTLGNIFNPFFTTKEGGTGLGLFITHEILQKHHGKIDVESKRNAGTTFKIVLPITAPNT